MYKIIVTRSLLGHFFWTLIGKNDKKLAESGMISSKENCFKVIKPIALKIKAKIVFIDLKEDYEE